MPRKLDADSQIGRRLRLRDLHLFFTVMQRESMAKAAKQLGMSQPAVSAVIASLEHTLGVRLFDRRPQGVTPTLYGQALLRRGSAAFDELKQAIRDIDGLADPSAGEILVGAPESIAASILPAIIDRVVQRHRRIVVHVTQVSTATLDFRELRERTLDIVIARIDALLDAGSLGEDLLVEKLFDDRIVFATGAASKWARRKSVRIADLRDAPWILTPPGTINAAIVSDAFRGGWAPRPRTEPRDILRAFAHALGGIRQVHHGDSVFDAPRERRSVRFESAADQASIAALAGCDRHAEKPHAESDR